MPDIATAPPARAPKVMIVDDCAVTRALVGRWIVHAGGFEVVATAADGRLALERLAVCDPDIVLLDLEMPELDGVEALPLLLRERPRLSVLVMSTLTQRNAAISLRCLALGATDYLPKPGGSHLILPEAFRQDLLAKLAGLAGRHAGALPRPGVKGRRPPACPARVRALVIGGSTGGPRAIGQLLRGSAGIAARVPILIAQHLPPIFTAVFAQQLAAETGLDVREARDGERVASGRVYLAPGGRHMGLAWGAGAVAIRLDDGPAPNHCRPALDVLMREAAEVYGSGALAVVLTGMGTDGSEGARAIVRAGGSVIVQDEATSVVWGMPGSIARAGLARHILPLGAIAGAVESSLAAGAALAGAAP